MFKIARKDLMLFVNDKKAVLLTFLMPMGLITLFVFAFGGNQKKRDMNEMRLLVADEDQSKDSKELVAQLDALPTLRIEQTDWEKAKQHVSSGERSSALRIFPSYSDSLQLGVSGFGFYFDQARQTEAAMIQGVLSGFLFAQEGDKVMRGSLGTQLETEFGMEDSSSREMVLMMVEQMIAKNSMQDPSVSMMRLEEVRSDEGVNPTLVHAVGGTAVMTLLFSVAAMGAGLLEEKEKGTLRKLLLAPIHPIQILFGKLISAVAIGFIQLWLMLIFAWLVFGLQILPHIPSLFLIIFFTALCCGSFGVFLASFCTTRKQVEGLSTIIVLVMSAIGGSMIPTFFMPEFMQQLSVLSVNYWSIQAFYDVFWRDAEWMVLFFKLMMLFSISLVMIAIAIPLYKRNILRLS